MTILKNLEKRQLERDKEKLHDEKKKEQKNILCKFNSL